MTKSILDWKGLEAVIVLVLTLCFTFAWSVDRQVISTVSSLLRKPLYYVYVVL